MQPEHIVSIIRLVFLWCSILFISHFLFSDFFWFLDVLLNILIQLKWLIFVGLTLFLGNFCSINGSLQFVFEMDTCFRINLISLLIRSFFISQLISLLWLELRLFSFVKCLKELFVLLDGLLFPLLFFLLGSFFCEDLGGWCSSEIVQSTRFEPTMSDLELSSDLFPKEMHLVNGNSKLHAKVFVVFWLICLMRLFTDIIAIKAIF